MTESNETPAGRVESLTAHVSSDLAQAVRELAEEGERSVSREVAKALRNHVETVRSFGPPGRTRTESPESAAGPLRESTRPAHAGEEA